MSVAELFAINDFTVIILNDQPEFFGSRIFKRNTEDYAVVVGSDVLNGDLLFGEVAVFL